MKIKFYDTSSLLKQVDTLFDVDEEIAVSSITFEELENIKTSSNKDADVKYAARKLLHLLDNNIGKYTTIIYQEKFLKPIKKQDLSITNDTKILSCAIELAKSNEVIFVTNDLALKHIAMLFFPTVESIADEVDDYRGFKDLRLANDATIAQIYEHPKTNFLDLLENEYCIIRNKDGEIIDKICWSKEEGYRPLKFSKFSSKWFGDIKPMKGDIYQQFVCDSFLNNKITMVKGPAGSGKTLLSLGFLFDQLERGKIDKIIVFCNTVATKDSAKLGFYPGTKDEKLLDSQIGNLLISKVGGRIEVERMMHDEELILLPMSDIRGYDTSGMRAGIYISEAQNLSVNLMKLALQRIGDDGICIIDGDCKTQVDDIQYAGSNNGMRRVSKVFRGNPIYGEIELQNIHRSEIGRLAELM